MGKRGTGINEGVSSAKTHTPSHTGQPDFRLPRAEMCNPDYDFTALHEWFGEKIIREARIALAKAGVTAPQNSTTPKTKQPTKLPKSA